MPATLIALVLPVHHLAAKQALHEHVLRSFQKQPLEQSETKYTTKYKALAPQVLPPTFGPHFMRLTIPDPPTPTSCVTGWVGDSCGGWVMRWAKQKQKQKKITAGTEQQKKQSRRKTTRGGGSW